jgi:hypothetical protein
MFTWGGRGFGGNPYQFLGRRPFREARLRAYLVRQHAAGRPLREILTDPYIARCGSGSLCRRVLVDPQTIEAFEANVRDELERLHP